MGYGIIYQLKSMASLPNVYGNTLSGHIYNNHYNLLRLNFWTAVCKRNAFLKRFYAEPMSDYRHCTVKDFMTNLDGVANTLLEYGVAVVPDFLPPNLHQSFCDYYSNIGTVQTYTNKYGRSVYVTGTVLSRDQQACSLISSAVSLVGAQLLGTTAHQRTKLELEDLTIESGDTDIGDINTNLHSDRFCPTIKSYYYPEGVVEGAAHFEFQPGSHLISKRFLEAYRAFYLKQSLGHIPKYPVQLDDWIDAPIVPIVNNPNTLVVAATHGNHRRSAFNFGNPTTRKMNRKNVMTLFYSQQTKLNILMN